MIPAQVAAHRSQQLWPATCDLRLAWYDTAMQRSTLLLIGLAALLLLLALAALLWRRYYRDDPANTARRVVKNSAVPLALRLFVRALDMAFLLILQRTLDAPQIGPYDLAVLFVGIYLATI